MKKVADCRDVEAWLDDWIAGSLPADRQRLLAGHADACPRCRRLLAIARDGVGPDAGEAPDLAPGVLEKTSGPACGRAEEQLPALVRGELDAVSREIVEAHLTHCAGCSALAAVLAEAERVLPALAELEPPPDLVPRVLAATRDRPRRERVAEWWQRILARPRASWELAYVGTLLLVLLLGNPVAAFREAGQQATRLADAGVRTAVTSLASRLPVPDVMGGQAAFGFTERLMTTWQTAVDTIGAELSRAWRNAQAVVDWVSQTVRDAAAWIASSDLGTVATRMARAWRGAGAVKHAPAAPPGG